MGCWQFVSCWSIIYSAQQSKLQLLLILGDKTSMPDCQPWRRVRHAVLESCWSRSSSKKVGRNWLWYGHKSQGALYSIEKEASGETNESRYCYPNHVFAKAAAFGQIIMCYKLLVTDANAVHGCNAFVIAGPRLLKFACHLYLTLFDLYDHLQGDEDCGSLLVALTVSRLFSLFWNFSWNGCLSYIRSMWQRIHCLFNY